MKREIITSILVAIICSCACTKSYSQEVLLVGDTTSMVNVYGDIRLGSANQYPHSKPKKTFHKQGYRIVLYRGEDKAEAQKTKSSFVRKYAQQECLIFFNSPTYYVRVGNFHTEKEAENFLTLINKSWPNAVIIEDLINVTL